MTPTSPEMFRNTRHRRDEHLEFSLPLIQVIVDDRLSRTEPAVSGWWPPRTAELRSSLSAVLGDDGLTGW